MDEKMKEHFVKRTMDHIKCVRKNIDHLVNKNQNLKLLLERKDPHDQTKFNDPEFVPYVYITWEYKCKNDNSQFEISDDIRKKMIGATNHHINHNKHHPEFWDSEFNEINQNDRDDVPDKPVKAYKMDIISLAEMVCDWHAVSLERGGTTQSWAEKNIGKRWLFNEEQIKNIFKFIEDLEDQNIFKESFKNYINK